MKSDSKGRRLTLDGNYEVLRSLRTGCNYSIYDQSKQESMSAFHQVYLIRPQYNGHSVGCNANFTID